MYRRLRKNKQGQVGSVFISGVGGAIAFGVLIITLSLLGQVLLQQQDAQGVQTSATTTNETLTANVTLANTGTPTIPNNIHNTTEVVWNNSAGVIVQLTSSTDYTLTTGGVFNISPETAGIDSADWNVNITYTYTIFAEDASYNITGGGLSGMLNVGNLAPTMGLVFGIVLVLSLLIMVVLIFGGVGGMGGISSGGRDVLETFKR